MALPGSPTEQVQESLTGHHDVPVPEQARRLRDGDRRQTTDLGEPAAEPDVPPSVRQERRRREEAARRRAAARAELTAHVAIYAAVVLLLFALWLVDGLLSGSGRYPWPLWPALGWGVTVVGQACTALLPQR